MKRAFYSYLGAALIQFIAFINLRGNERLLGSDHVFGSFMFLFELLIIPLMPVLHLYVFFVNLFAGKPIGNAILVLLFIIFFPFLLWISAVLSRAVPEDQAGVKK